MNALEKLIHRLELRLQHMEDDFPERERWGHEAWDKHEMMLTRGFIAELKDLKAAQEKEKRNTLCDLYVIDKRNNRIHRIGEDIHDSLIVYPDGGVMYYNLQNGDGGGEDNDQRAGYCILQTQEGALSGEYGIHDKRFEEHIKKYMEEHDEG